MGDVLEELGVRAGVPRTTVAQIESGKTDPRLGTVMSIARVLRVRVGDLVGESALIEALVPVPVIQQRIPIGDAWPVEAEHVPLAKVNPGLVAIEVRGDCMSPRIENGDFVIIDRERQPEVGKVIVFWWQGEWTLKRLRRRNGKWWMVPDNPAFESMEMEGKDVESLGVVIRVVKPEP